MSDFSTVLTQTPLSSGGHSADDKEACVMEKVHILWAINNNVPVDLTWTDMPICTNPLVARLAQGVNDALGQRKRQQLNLVIPRLLRARQTTQDAKINTGLVLWAIDKQIAWWNEPRRTNQKSRDQMVKARELLGQVLENPTDYELQQRFYDVATHLHDYALRHAMDALVQGHVNGWPTRIETEIERGTNGLDLEIERRIHDFDTDALIDSLMRLIQREGADPVAVLDEALDVWEEQVVKADEPLYISQEWEDAALTFVADYMSSMDDDADTEYDKEYARG
jgi:hypothetical protein